MTPQQGCLAYDAADGAMHRTWPPLNVAVDRPLSPVPPSSGEAGGTLPSTDPSSRSPTADRDEPGVYASCRRACRGDRLSDPPPMRAHASRRARVEGACRARGGAPAHAEAHSRRQRRRTRAGSGGAPAQASSRPVTQRFQEPATRGGEGLVHGRMEGGGYRSARTGPTAGPDRPPDGGVAGSWYLLVTTLPQWGSRGSWRHLRSAETPGPVANRRRRPRDGSPPDMTADASRGQAQKASKAAWSAG